MKNISKYKVDKSILITLIIMAIISVISITMAQAFLPSYMQDLNIKQIFWYICGFVIAFSIMFIGNDFFYKNAYILYGVGIVALILVLIFGKDINGIKSWFELPGIGTIQPSEFMKIFLILVYGRIIYDYNEYTSNKTFMTEFLLLVKIGLFFIPPAILTYLQPDTGILIIYLVITIVMLFTSGIRIRWFFILGGIIAAALTIILCIFFFNKDLFINIFSSSLFYRIDRLLDWSNTSGMQLNNSLYAIGNAGLFGNGFNSNIVYFPEGQTDFIFATYSANFGLLGAIFLIMILLFFNIRLINTATKTNNLMSKYIIAGILGMLIYQQVQNIGMTIGLLPITGITLPFISYGGSSLLSYMLMIGIIFNISNDNIRYTN